MLYTNNLSSDCLEDNLMKRTLPSGNKSKDNLSDAQTERFGRRIRDLEEENDGLQELVCYLLTKNQILRDRLTQRH